MPTPLKETFYSDKNLKILANRMAEYCVDFNPQNWLQTIKNTDWEKLELRNRGQRIAENIVPFLPQNKPDAAQAIRFLGGYKWDGHFFVFPYLVPSLFRDDWDLAIELLEFLTQISTSEFAVRPFIEQNPEKMFAQINRWALHKNEHVRRLASECTRPALPWASKVNYLTQNPDDIIHVLQKLKNDPSEYVRRSVANNLNDISKLFPQKVLAVAKKWYGYDKNTDKLLKHALRTLLKNANPEAYQVLDFSTKPAIKIRAVVHPVAVKMGNKFGFSFTLSNESDTKQKLNILYVLEFFRPNKKPSKKVFSVAEKTFLPNKTLSFNKLYHFSDKTTRKHYVGEHKFYILGNGKVLYSTTFDVVA